MKIGIVGAENTHTAAIAKTLNVDGEVPGFQVTYVWGETDEFAKKAAEAGQIPNIVKNPEDMLGHVDAAIVDHRHGKYHLPAARPFVEAGLPVFIDKPFCIDLAEGVEFVRYARSKGVPVTSHSAMSTQKSTLELAEALKGIGRIRSIVTAGPVEIDSQYGGVYFYGIHQVALFHELTKAKPASVSAVRTGADGIAVISFDDGSTGVVHCLKDYKAGFRVSVFGDAGALHSDLPRDENIYLTGIKRFCGMFETGKEPVEPESYLLPVAILSAMQEAFDTGKTVKVAEIPKI